MVNSTAIYKAKINRYHEARNPSGMKQKETGGNPSARNIRKQKGVTVLNSPQDLLAIERMNESGLQTRGKLQIAIAKSLRRAQEILVF